MTQSLTERRTASPRRLAPPLGVFAGVLLIVCGAAGSAAGAGAQRPSATEGGDSPQAVVAAMQQAARADDWGAAFALMLPAARHEIARPIVEGAAMIVALADPASPIAERWSAEERAVRTRAFRQATEGLRRVWTPYGLDGIVGAPPRAEATAVAIDRALGTADLPALVRDTMLVLDAAAPALGVPAADRPHVPQFGAVTGYRVRGDRATARDGKTTVDFAKIGGRWYLAPPAGR